MMCNELQSSSGISIMRIVKCTGEHRLCRSSGLQGITWLTQFRSKKGQFQTISGSFLKINTLYGAILTFK